MSENGNQPPLTRREIRERERAEAEELAAREAASHGAPAPGATAASAPTGIGYGAATGYGATDGHGAAAGHSPGGYDPARGGYGPAGGAPSAPVPARPSTPPPAAPPSRRSLRGATAPASGTSGPVVRPPAASGGMRGLDETGRLTPIHETAERVAIRPPAEPGTPMRTSALAPSPPPRARAAAPGGGATAPAAPPYGGRTFPRGAAPDPAAPPRRGAPSPVAPPHGGLPTPPPGRSATPPMGIPAAPGFYAPPSTPTPAPVAEPPRVPRLSSFSAPPVAPASPAFSPVDGGAPAPPVGPAAPPDLGGPVMRWTAMVPGAAQAEPSASPFESASAPAFESAATGSLFDSRQPADPAASLFPLSTGHDDDEDIDEEPDDRAPRGPSYTWLQYLILVAVAFVLGLLIWELVTRGEGAVAQGPGQVLQHLAARAAPPLDLAR